jgi:hypothetical protein
MTATKRLRVRKVVRVTKIGKYARAMGVPPTLSQQDILDR